jgi:hypothetical protein
MGKKGDAESTAKTPRRKATPNENSLVHRMGQGLRVRAKVAVGKDQVPLFNPAMVGLLPLRHGQCPERMPGAKQ